MVAFLIVAAPAWATDVPITCATRQNALTTASHDDVIILDSSASPGGLCNAQYTRHNFGTLAAGDTPNDWTLKGRDGMNDGFDGSGLAAACSPERTCTDC